MTQQFNNIAGTFLIDASAAFLNGAGLGAGEDRNVVIPKTFKERINGKDYDVPYVSAQAWRRWLRDTCNEENDWPESQLRSIKESEKGSTSKISTELNPIDFPEDDLFGYMRSATGKEESVQRTSALKTSILKGIKGKNTVNKDDAFVHLKEGSPLPYSTKFYSSHLEGFFNLEHYRLGVYENLGSHVELSKELLDQKRSELKDETIYNKFKKYTHNDAENLRKQRAAGLLKGLVYLRGGAKQSAFGNDVAPKVIILAGLTTANPIFNGVFDGSGNQPKLDIKALEEIKKDYADKLSTPIYIGRRKGYLENETDVDQLSDGEAFVVDSPVQIAKTFNQQNLGQNE